MEEIKKTQSTAKSDEMPEKIYIGMYSRMATLIFKKVNDPSRFKDSEKEEFEKLKKESKSYKKGKYGIKNQILCIDTQKMYLSPDFKLPQTFVDVIVKKENVNERQYLKM